MLIYFYGQLNTKWRITMSNDSDYRKILRGLAFTNPSQAKVDTVHILSGRTSRVPTTTLSSSLTNNVLNRNSLQGTKKFFGNDNINTYKAIGTWVADKTKVYVAYQDMIAPFRQDTKTIVETPTDFLNDIEKNTINRIERVFVKEYERNPNSNGRRNYLNPTLKALGGVEANGYPFVSEFGLLEKCNPRERYLTFIQERYHRYLSPIEKLVSQTNDPKESTIDPNTLGRLALQSKTKLNDYTNKNTTRYTINNKTISKTEFDNIIKTNRIEVGMLNQAHCAMSLDDSFLRTNEQGGTSSKFDDALYSLKNSRVLTNDLVSNNNNNASIKGLIQTINLNESVKDSFYLRAITTGIPKSIQQSCFGLDIERYDPQDNEVLNLGKDLFNLPGRKIVFVGDMDSNEQAQWNSSKAKATTYLNYYTSNETNAWLQEKSHPKKGDLAKLFKTSKKSWAVSLHSLDVTLGGSGRPNEYIDELQYALYDQNNVDRLIETSSSIESNEFNRSFKLDNATIKNEKIQEVITTFFPFVKSFDNPSHFQRVAFIDIFQLCQQLANANTNKEQTLKILSRFYRLGGSSYFRYINQNPILLAENVKGFVEELNRQDRDAISTQFVNTQQPNTIQIDSNLNDGGSCAINIFEKNLRLSSAQGLQTTILNFVADDNSKFIDVRLPSSYYRMGNEFFKRRYDYSLAYNTNSNVVLLCSIDNSENNLYGRNDTFFRNVEDFKRFLKPSEVRKNSSIKDVYAMHNPPSKVLYKIKDDIYQKFKDMLTKNNRFSGKDKEVERFLKKRNLMDDLLFVLDSNIWDIGYLYNFKTLTNSDMKLFCSDVLLSGIESIDNAINIAYPKDKFSAFRNIMRGSLPIPKGFDVISSRDGAKVSLKPFEYVPHSKTFNPYELFIFDNFMFYSNTSVDTSLKNKIKNRLQSSQNIDSMLDVALPHSNFDHFMESKVYDIDFESDIESGYFWKNIKYDVLAKDYMEEIKNINLDCLLPFTKIGQKLFSVGQSIKGKNNNKLNFDILGSEVPDPKVFDPYEDTESFIDCLYYYSKMLSNDVDFDIETSKGHKLYDIFNGFEKKTIPFDFLINPYTNETQLMDFDSDIKNSFSNLEFKPQSTNSALTKEYYAMRLIALLGCFFSRIFQSENNHSSMILGSDNYLDAFSKMATIMLDKGFNSLSEQSKSKCREIRTLLKINATNISNEEKGQAFVQFIRCEIKPFVDLLKKYGFEKGLIESKSEKYKNCVIQVNNDSRWKNYPIKAFIKNTNRVDDDEAIMIYCRLSEVDKDALVDLSQQSSISTLAATMAIINPLLNASEHDIDFLRRTGGTRFMDVIDASGFYKLLEKEYEGAGVDLDRKLSEMENPTSYSGENQQLEFIVEEGSDAWSVNDQNVFDDIKGKKESKLSSAKIATIGLGLLAFSGLAYVGYRVMKKQPIIPTNVSSKMKGLKEKIGTKSIKKIDKPKR